MKAKKNAPKTKKAIIRVDSIKSDDKQDAIIPREQKDLESQENPGFKDSHQENEVNSDDDYAEESETIARQLTHKIVNYIRNPAEEDMQEEGEDKDQSNHNNQNESAEDGENIKKNDDLELRTVNRSIKDVMKDDHFYQEENSGEIKSDKKKRFYKKKSILEISLVTGFNSIKYRLKKNYFGGAQR
jgi:hypothetical protein